MRRSAPAFQEQRTANCGKEEPSWSNCVEKSQGNFYAAGGLTRAVVRGGGADGSEIVSVSDTRRARRGDRKGNRLGCS